MRILLATGSDEVNIFLTENVPDITYVKEVSSKKQLLRSFDKEDEVYDLIIFSTLLPGDENITKMVFKISNKQECRFIVLAKNAKETCLQDLFFLGIRDFLFDPINPHALLERISVPASFKEAVQILSLNEPTRSFKKLLKNLINKNKEESYLTNEAQSIMDGITKLFDLDFKEDKDIEDSLFEIEQEIIKRFLISFEKS